MVELHVLLILKFGFSPREFAPPSLLTPPLVANMPMSSSIWNTKTLQSVERIPTTNISTIKD